MQSDHKAKENRDLIHSWLKDTNFYSQSVLLSHRKIKQVAEKRVLHLFQEASVRVPAYQDFLKKNKIDATKVHTLQDFEQVPVTTKENYIALYSAENRCWDGSLESMHMISTSSGTTGQPHYWPRDVSTEIDGAYFHEFIFKELCQVDQKKTLLINGFALGTWIAGTFTLACANWVTLKGYSLTTITPSNKIESIIEALMKLGTTFDQVIITGHSPFLKEVIEQAVEMGVDLAACHVILLGTGQSITENWRQYMMELTVNTQASKILNVYGSADAALMGTETPYSIAARQLLSKNMLLSQEFFHDDRLPSIYCFDPRLTYFETVDHQLHVTKRTGCPLIRYNMLDNGGVLSASKLQKFLSDKRLPITQGSAWQLPYVYLFGREKFMVKIFGANIYTEHVQLALNHSKLQKFLTGRYLLEMSYDSNQDPQLMCRIELNHHIKSSRSLLNLVQTIFIEEVRKINTEYNDALNAIGDKAKPVIMFYSYQDENFFPAEKIKKTG